MEQLDFFENGLGREGEPSPFLPKVLEFM